MENWLENFELSLAMDVEEEEDTVSDPDLDAAIAETDAKFKKACQQLILLNNQIDGIQVRYDRAAKHSGRVAKYNYRIKLCVVEGVRNMFYEYAVRLADKIDDLRRQAGMIVLREEEEDEVEEFEEEDEDEENFDEDEEDEEDEAMYQDDGFMVLDVLTSELVEGENMLQDGYNSNGWEGHNAEVTIGVAGGQSDTDDTLSE